MDPVLVSVGISVLKKGVEVMIDRIQAGAPDSTAAALRGARAKKAIKVATSKLDQVRYVKTIWQIDKSVDLFGFYHPSKIDVERKRLPVHRLTVHRLKDIPVDGNVVIQGIVGQGKSIFLRYLTCVEAVDGTTLPLFLEFRRLQAPQTLHDLLLAELRALGLPSSDAVFRHLAENGLVILFLDAFDEIGEAYRAAVIAELESMAQEFPLMRIVLTARPNCGIERSSAFRVVQLSPLRYGECDEVIERICHDKATAATIINGLKSRSNGHIRELLTTPLLITLLVLRYKADQSIPENYEAFFKDLFLLLLQRHDKSKAGYVRERKSKLGDGALEKIFFAMSFIAKRRGGSVLAASKMYDITKEALTACDIAAEPDKVLDDIRSITCLLLEEGGEYRFIHNIVQEYHAACFVAGQPDESAQRFYSAMADRWSAWQEELGFLETLDAFRCLHWFLIPMLERVVGAKNDDVNLREVMLNIEIRLAPTDDPSHVIGIMLSRWPTLRAIRTGFRFKKIFDFAMKIPKSIRHNTPRAVTMLEIVEQGILVEEARALAREMLFFLRADLDRARRTTEVIGAQRSLMEF